MNAAPELLSLLTGPMGFARNAAAGKVALVTGAGRGIGQQAALAFGLLGARVVVAELGDEGTLTRAAIRAQGGTALFVQTDVSNPASVAALHEQTLAAFGRVDILVNNAIFCPAADFDETPLELWDRVMAVNLRGAFLTCQTFLPGMLERHGGVILNLVSTDAMPGLSAYIASKQGLVGFSQSLALETGERGVQVIPFAPGMVDTPGIRAVAEGLAPRLGMTPDQFLEVSLHPAYPGLMPAEHAGAAAVYLALRLAQECHGQLTNGYEVLERAGVIAPGEAPQPTAPVSTPPPVPANSEALANLAQQLAAEIVATGAEFEKLPVFVRPIARQGFKSKAGQSLEAWRHTLGQLAQAEVGGPWPAGLAARLAQLCEYFRGVPAETARFSRDPQLLRQVSEISEKRIALIQRLQALIR